MEITKDKLLEKYRNMPIDQLASIEVSYQEEDYYPASIEIINQVLSDRREELDKFKEKESGNNGFNDKLSARKALGISFFEHVLIIIGICIAVGSVFYHLGLRSEGAIGKIVILFSIGISYLIYVIVYRYKNSNIRGADIQSKISKYCLILRSKKQKFIVIITSVAVLIILIFPPFHITRGHVGINVGYSFFAKPPHVAASINFEILFVQIAIVIVIGIVLFFLFRDQSNNPH